MISQSSRIVEAKTGPAGPKSAGEDGPARSRARAIAQGALALVIAAVFVLPSCRSTSAPEAGGAITLKVDAVPLLLKADSTSVATIWATVLQDERPAPDSTVVCFAASLGQITSEAYTRDGLARASFTAGSAPGVAAIVAQAKGVRDTVVVTVY
jgi:hypothetical protein